MSYVIRRFVPVLNCRFTWRSCASGWCRRDFFGRFYIYTPGGADLRSSETSVWYEADCIVTNVSVNVTADEAIESSIDFVTTGKFKLLMGGLPSYVLTEEPAKLLQEDGSGILLSQLDQ